MQVAAVRLLPFSRRFHTFIRGNIDSHSGACVLTDAACALFLLCRVPSFLLFARAPGGSAEARIYVTRTHPNLRPLTLRAVKHTREEE